MLESLLKEFEHHLSAALTKFKEDIGGVRSGRPTTQLVENVMVEYAGGTFPVKQLASLGIKPPREIDITVWDQAALSAVMKAIENAKIGLSLQNEGNIIRAFLPPLTQERRDEFTKLVKRMAEDARISVRANRDEVNKKLKAAESGKELNEDQVFKAKERVQKLVDGVNKNIETLVEGKLKELQE